MTGYNQPDDRKNGDSSKTRSKFIDVNPVEVTGEIPRPANADPVSGQISQPTNADVVSGKIPRPLFVTSTADVNKSSLRSIINAVDFPGATGIGDTTDGAGATVRLRSEYTLIQDAVSAPMSREKRRSKFRFFR
jgi:hypothetical protein